MLSTRSKTRYFSPSYVFFSEQKQTDFPLTLQVERLKEGRKEGEEGKFNAEHYHFDTVFFSNEEEIIFPAPSLSGIIIDAGIELCRVGGPLARAERALSLSSREIENYLRDKNDELAFDKSLLKNQWEDFAAFYAEHLLYSAVLDLLNKLPPPFESDFLRALSYLENWVQKLNPPFFAGKDDCSWELYDYRLPNGKAPRIVLRVKIGEESLAIKSSLKKTSDLINQKESFTLEFKFD